MDPHMGFCFDPSPSPNLPYLMWSYHSIITRYIKYVEGSGKILTQITFFPSFLIQLYCFFSRHVYQLTQQTKQRSNRHHWHPGFEAPARFKWWVACCDGRRCQLVPWRLWKWRNLEKPRKNNGKIMENHRSQSKINQNGLICVDLMDNSVIPPLLYLNSRVKFCQADWHRTNNQLVDGVGDCAGERVKLCSTYLNGHM